MIFIKRDNEPDFADLVVDEYTPTPAFQAIEKHVAVALDDEKRGLMAVVGPAGDELSLRYARLFAAAPDLLAACEAALAYIPGSEIRSWPPGFRLRNEALATLHAAIAKARGE